MNNIKHYFYIILVFLLIGGCADLTPKMDQNVSVVTQIPKKNCVFLGEYSASAGPGPYQLENLKDRASYQGANTVIIKSLRLNFIKQFRKMQTTTTIEAYRCT